ncbi:AraC family transcriptional regulator [Dulcicalothrix desertica PCC 7102]|uniref:AraC family transcriptional regulator n=1 Tax=Dulcicalothrix desertica PCC 7102 TaxID=232991 RepID=A0A3S1IU28_9CYAN|nr:AraC family transcriptional regulator [Dulcicalothrix desertica]RUT02433.1 AraC family transcriptional regulator [Dulcicalothrix desertica PCC 7102]TWH55350.1 AraC family transcriptional regulator [Dulcicalothrix desertica PCC 7102]
MLDKSLVAVDVTQEQTILNALPLAPIISSAAKGWNKIYVAYHRQPAWETPELSFAQHNVVIYTGQPVQGKRYSEGHSLEGTYTSGKIGIYPATILQRIFWSDEAEFVQLCISPQTLLYFVNEELNTHSIELAPQFAIDDSLVYGIGLALKTELEVKNTSNNLYLESAITLLSIHLLKHYTNTNTVWRQNTGGLSPSKLQSVLDYIHTYFDRDLGLVELAALVQLSPNYFVQLFKQSTGVTPYQYVLNYRIKTAKHLLAQSKLSISQIAQNVGFFDQSRLTKLFRQHVGVTPKQYRNQI